MKMKRFLALFLLLVLTVVWTAPLLPAARAETAASMPRELEVLRRAQKIYDEITEEFDEASYQTNLNHILRGYTSKLSEAKQFGALYKFHTNIASTLINLEIGLLMEDPKRIASAAGSAGLDLVLDEVLGALDVDIDMSLEDFVFSQAKMAANSVARWDIYDTMKRAQENGGRFASYADAKLFLRRYLENEMNIATLRMAAGYYEHLMNRNVFETFGDLFTHVAVSNLGGKLGKNKIISSYLAGKASTVLYDFLDLIGQQVNETYVTSWIKEQKDLVGEIERYFPADAAGLGLESASAPKRLSRYTGNWACDAEDSPSLTVGKTGDLYFVFAYYLAQDKLDRYVFAGVNESGEVCFLNAARASVLTMTLLDAEISVQIDAYGNGRVNRRAFRYHWQEYAWPAHWVNTENPATVMDITSNGDGTLHLAAHFAPDVNVAFDFVPADYEIIYFDRAGDPFRGGDMRIDGETGQLELFIPADEMDSASPLYRYVVSRGNTYFFVTDNPPDLRRYGWTPHDEYDGYDDDGLGFISLEEAQQLFASISETPLMACAGAGAWEGRLKIGADGSFTGYYYDADAGDEVVYEVSFFGTFNLADTQRWGNTSYGLWAETMNTLQTPGTVANSVYGDRIVYDEPPFQGGEYLLLTLPGADNDAIPEMVQGEIGGTLDEWEDYGRFITLSRTEDGWGFFADPADPPAYDLEPIPTAEENRRVAWPGIWKRQDQTSETWLYILPEENGVHLAIMTYATQGYAHAILGDSYFQDEITADFYSDEGIHAGLIRNEETNGVSLTVFGFSPDVLGPWEGHIEGDYQYMGPLNDPNSQIPASVWELVNNGPSLSETPAPTAVPYTGGGQVLVNDEVCTIALLGAEMRNSSWVVSGAYPEYRLSVTNHLGQDFRIRAGQWNREPNYLISYGSVDGAKLASVNLFASEQNPTVQAGSTLEMTASVMGSGYGYQSLEELVNVVLYFEVQYGNQYREYAVHINEGGVYERRQAAGYVTKEAPVFGFTYEIPDDWNVYSDTTEGVEYYGEYWIEPQDRPWIFTSMSLLPPPTMSASISMDGIVPQLELTEEDGEGIERKEDRLIGGYPTTVFHYAGYAWYYVHTSAGVLRIMTPQYLPKQEREIVDHCLNSIHFTAGSAGNEAETPAGEGASLAVSEGDAVYFGHYEQDNNTRNGAEPIAWEVMAIHETERRALLMSRYILDAVPYANRDGDVTWETSNARAWLNGTFLHTAFTAQEQAALLKSIVRNQPSFEDGVTIIFKAPYDTDAGNDTEDRVFLFSYQEINMYLMLTQKRQAVPTAYARAQGAYIDSNNLLHGQAAGSWWTRTPGKAQNKVLLVDHSGGISNSATTYAGVGIRPVIRVSLDALGWTIEPEQAAAPTETATAAPTAIPTVPPTAVPTAAPASANQADWTGYWMTRDDSLAELIITDNGNGTLHAHALFLPSTDFDATLTPQADGSMRFEDAYGALIGVLVRQRDGTLRFTVTGGYAYDDEEATEYQGYYARGFTYSPAVYEEMWYQTPRDAAGSEDDWLGSWTVMNLNGASALRIDRINGALNVDVTLGRYHFSGLADLDSDTVLSLYGDDFSCMLTLNRKLHRIAMMEVGSAYDGVYDFVGNAYYGVLIYQKTDASSAAPAASQPASTQAPSSALLPIPGKPGSMQVPVSRVDATSYIVGKNDPDAYAPSRMIDGDETTAFQFSTKTTKLGEAFLYFDFDAPVTLDELWMKNGFWKISGGNDQYTRNSRVKKMTIFVRPAGSSAYQLLRDVTLKDDGARKDWKVIHLDGADNVTGVRIRIDAIYTGSKFKTDVCISEIMFVQKAE